MFRLTSNVNIGNYQLNGGLNSVKIKRSVKEIVDTAVIKMPGTGVVNKKDTPTDPTSSIKTSALFHEGDLVNIDLGYNGELNNEFKGFVRRVNASVPVEIECEGYAWQLRRQRPLVKTYKSISLKDFLKILVAGTDIKLSPFIADVPLVNLKINHASNLEVLEHLKTKVHLAVYFQFDTLYAGLEEGIPGNTVNYRLGWNCVRDNNLKYRNAADTRTMFQFTCKKGKNDKRPLIQVGDSDGALVKENIAFINDHDWLQRIANDELKKAKYTGYEGHISGFLQPYCQPCDTAHVIDKLYNALGGDYFVEGIEVDFDMNGGKRKTHIGRALSVGS